MDTAAIKAVEFLKWMNHVRKWAQKSQSPVEEVVAKMQDPDWRVIRISGISGREISLSARWGVVEKLLSVIVEPIVSPPACPKRGNPNRTIRARLPEPIPQRQQRSASFAFGDALLSKELVEEVFCWFPGVPFHAFQSSLDAFYGFHPVLSF